MNIKELFEGVDTSNIDMEKIEKLSKETPNIIRDRDMFSIKTEYESFYEKYEYILSDKHLKNILEILPLIDFPQPFIQNRRKVVPYTSGRGRVRFRKSNANSLIDIAVRTSHFTEMPEKIGYFIAHTSRQTYAQRPKKLKRKYRVIKGVVPKRLSILRKSSKKDSGK